MPVSNVFDPNTGGAIGGGGGAVASATLYDIPWGDPINLTDGSWTLLDPSSLVKSVAFGGGFNTVTFNALAVGSQNYNWTSSGNILSPRWYKKVLIDGTQITTDDITNAMFYMEVDNSIRDFNNNVVNGICEDPTATVLNTLRGTGATYNMLTPGGSNAPMGVWTVNSSYTAANSTNNRVFTQSQWGGRHAGSTSFILLDASGFRVQNGSRNGSVALSSTVDAHYVVGPGTRGIITIAEDDQVKFKAYHKAVKMDLGAIL
tara:strand:+ start:849 stop:1628 length:780 start_codon:yes stop_codon:yes gene_type:complete